MSNKDFVKAVLKVFPLIFFFFLRTQSLFFFCPKLSLDAKYRNQFGGDMS